MKRRRALATTGVVIGAIAGCAAEGPTDAATPTASDETPISGTPADIVVEKAITYESLMGADGVLAPDGEQFVVASLGDRHPPEHVTFTFETDQTSWSVGLPDTRGGRNAAIAGHSRPYVAFTVPSPLSASNPRIRRSDGTGWPLSNAAQERLAASAPRYELDELTAPERVQQGDPLSVSLTVTNVSETRGRFLAALYWPTSIADDDESHVVDRTVRPASPSLRHATSTRRTLPSKAGRSHSPSRGT